MRKEVYTIQEVAQLLQFSEQTIRDWVRSGRISAGRIGLRAWRIPRSEVERLLAQLQISDHVLDSVEDSTSGANEGKIANDIRTPMSAAA
jgi:excisionase family DNA binding protein